MAILQYKSSFIAKVFGAYVRTYMQPTNVSFYAMSPLRVQTADIQIIEIFNNYFTHCYLLYFHYPFELRSCQCDFLKI